MPDYTALLVLGQISQCHHVPVIIIVLHTADYQIFFYVLFFSDCQIQMYI